MSLDTQSSHNPVSITGSSYLNQSSSRNGSQTMALDTLFNRDTEHLSATWTSFLDYLDKNKEFDFASVFTMETSSLTRIPLEKWRILWSLEPKVDQFKLPENPGSALSDADIEKMISNMSIDEFEEETADFSKFPVKIVDQNRQSLFIQECRTLCSCLESQIADIENRFLKNTSQTVDLSPYRLKAKQREKAICFKMVNVVKSIIDNPARYFEENNAYKSLYDFLLSENRKFFLITSVLPLLYLADESQLDKCFPPGNWLKDQPWETICRKNSTPEDFVGYCNSGLITLGLKDIMRHYNNVDLDLKKRPHITDETGEIKNLKEGFQTEFIEDGRLGLLKMSLKSLCGKFNSDQTSNGGRYLAPYLAIVQSSGTGKSRLVDEYSKNSYSFSICLRSEESNGYPLRSYLADHLVRSMSDIFHITGRQTDNPSCLFVSYYLSFYTACLHVLWNFLLMEEAKMEKGNRTPEEIQKIKEDVHKAWIESEKSPTTQKLILQTHAQFIRFCFDPIVMNEAKSNDSSNWKDEVPYFIAADLLHIVCRSLEEMFQRNEILKTSDPILFIHDEAKELISKAGKEDSQTFFHYIRIAMFMLPRGLKKMLIALTFLDTFGTVANYVPVNLPDPSLRYIRAKELFPPFLRVVNQCNPEILKYPNDEERILANIQNTGRYLWKTYKNIGNMFNLAAYKLLNQDPIMANGTENEILAVIGARLALSFLAQEKLAYSLVRSHAATLYLVSKDKSLVMFGYPSELALALAATKILNAAYPSEQNRLNWESCLKKLNAVTQTGIVEAGVRGEIVARILLLMAMDRAREGNMKNLNMLEYAKPVKLEQYLKTLLGEIEFAKMCKSALRQISANHLKILLSGLVNITHFEYLNGIPTMANIRSFYKHCCGIFCRRNQATIDLLIPVYLNETTITFIAIQVKLYEKGTGFPKAIPKDIGQSLGLYPESIDVPHMYLFMQLGSRGPKAEKVSCLGRNEELHPIICLHHNIPKSDQKDRSETSPHLLLGTFGLSCKIFPFLKKSEVVLLELLCRAWADPLQAIQHHVEPDLIEADRQLLLQELYLQNGYPDALKTKAKSSDEEQGELADTEVQSMFTVAQSKKKRPRKRSKLRH